ncbi:MAG: sigma-70 family RNA polymerase sigma factor [Bacteroidia bacterium]|nr:sigma-70 family RNA polymerase sigma factor [Bacteroidia bacterium]
MSIEDKGHQHAGKHHQSAPEIEQELRQINAAKLDPAQFQPLYDKYYKPIYIFIFRRTGNEDLTSDLTSQVFLRALINIKKYEHRGLPFSAWLFRIAFNEVNMFFRKTNTQRVISIDTTKINSIAVEAELESTAETDKLLMDCIAELSADAIQVIELRYFESRSFNEVARLLGISESNAKVKVYRILEKLKRIILKKKK